MTTCQNLTLLLWLEGVMQSYGASSRCRIRDTLEFPTRSAVLGMMASAAAMGGEQKEWLQKMSHFRQDVKAYAPAFEKDGKFIPIHQPMLEDFQTMGCGWKNERNSWEGLHVPRKLDGSVSSTGPKTFVKRYIPNMAYAVALELPEEDATFFCHAFWAPRWEVHLGRAAYPPSAPVGVGCFDSKDDAFLYADFMAREKNRACSLEVFECRNGEQDEADDVLRISDVPVCFGVRKEYRSRRVALVRHDEWEDCDRIG